MRWKQLDSKIVYENPWLRVREDTVIRPDGRQGIYSVIERSPANFIIAEDDGIYFIREYRYPIKKTILQLPAGTTDKNSTHLASAKKELFEETGLKAKKWEKLGKFYIGPGHESIYANVFIATELEMTPRVETEDEAILEVVKFSLSDVRQLIASDKIECGITLAALNLYLSRVYPSHSVRPR